MSFVQQFKFSHSKVVFSESKALSDADATALLNQRA